MTNFEKLVLKSLMVILKFASHKSGGDLRENIETVRQEIKDELDKN
jgi:hypothetical protein